MENIIVYVDDAVYAMQILQPLCAPKTGQCGPTHWIVVGCAPRVTHRASKWVTNSARASWRERWAEKVFPRLLPLLEGNGNTVETRLAQTSLSSQTESIIKQYGVARVLDARRPKLGPDLQNATPSKVQERRGIFSYLAAFAGSGLLVTSD